VVFLLPSDEFFFVLFFFFYFFFKKIVKVFHAQTSSNQTLQNELHNIATLLHHFEDSLEGNDVRERDIVQGASAASAEMIRRILGVLKDGPNEKSHAGTPLWSYEQRGGLLMTVLFWFLFFVLFKDMAEWFKGCKEKQEKVLLIVYNS
jgi:hypothetical protein